MPIMKLGRLKWGRLPGNRNFRWALYGLLVVVSITLWFVGSMYKPSQSFTFLGQMTSGGEIERGTVVSFEAHEDGRKRFVTATRGLDILGSSGETIIRLNTGFVKCSDVNNSFELPPDQSAGDLLHCTEEENGVQLSPTLPAFAMDFTKLVIIKVTINGPALLSIEEAGRLGDFPFSRDVVVDRPPTSPWRPGQSQRLRSRSTFRTSHAHWSRSTSGARREGFPRWNQPPMKKSLHL